MIFIDFHRFLLIFNTFDKKITKNKQNEKRKGKQFIKYQNKKRNLFISLIINKQNIEKININSNGIKLRVYGVIENYFNFLFFCEN